MIQPTKNAPVKSEIEIIETNKTATVSGTGELVYSVLKDINGDIFLKLVRNSQTGFFSNEHLSLNSIISSLEEQKGQSFTSFIFQGLFKGKSVNTPGFLVAVLLNEEVLTFSEGMKRKYIYVSADKLLAKIHEAKPRKTVKKVARKTARKSSK
jgi:hypothetical protein